MKIYADPHRCPDCGSMLEPGTSRCPSCALELGGPLGQELFATLTRADALLGRLRLLAQQETLVGAGVTVAPRPASAGAAPIHGRPDEPPVALKTSRSQLVRAASVPQILLALGAVCLLVAALVFLAVTWELLGVGGRTATLVAFTVLGGALTRAVAGRSLRGATEALGLVTAGLATLDVIGAEQAGWLGDPSEAAFSVLLGLLMVLGGLAATATLSRTPAGGFTAGEATAVVGTALLLHGLGDLGWAGVGELAAVGATAAVAAVTWSRVRPGRNLFRVAAWGATGLTVLAWLTLVTAGLGHLGDTLTIREIWGGLRAWPLLAAAALAGGVAALRVLPPSIRVTALGAGLVPLGVVMTVPAYDEPVTVVTGVLLAAVACLVVAIAVLPRPWATAPLGAVLLGLLQPGVVALMLLEESTGRYAEAAAQAWAGTPGGRLTAADTDGAAPWLLLLVVAVVLGLGWAAQRALGRPEATMRTRLLMTAATMALGTLASFLLYDVPVWWVLAATLGAALVFAGPALARDEVDTTAVAALLLALAVPLSWYDELLGTVTLVAALVFVAAVHVRSRRRPLVLASGLALPLLVADLVWTAGALAGLDGPWAAVIGVLLLAAVVLGRSSLRISDNASLATVELGALLGAFALGSAGVGTAAEAAAPGWAAVHLTLVGATACILALLRPPRRPVAWLGAVLLAAATWVRLADLGVQEPEPYTLPSALVLLGVGWVHLRRHPQASTQRAWGPGLALALVPSLLWVLEDPLTVRAVALGLACLALVITGAVRGWSAPLAYGAAVGLVVVLVEAAPYLGDTVPRWALLGAAGVLLIGLGVTWERRLQEARAAADYVRRLR